MLLQPLLNSLLIGVCVSFFAILIGSVLALSLIHICVTRQEAATLLTRQRKLSGEDTAADGSIVKQFTDGGTIADWAAAGVAYCAKTGLVPVSYTHLCINTGKLLKAFPAQTFNAGIAEQNAMGVASGMAATGLTVFAHSFGCFAARR